MTGQPPVFTRFVRCSTLLLDENDPGVAKGHHWSMSLHPDVGMPISSVLVWSSSAFCPTTEEIGRRIRDERGAEVTLPADVGPDTTLTVEVWAPVGQTVCWAEVTGDGLRVAVEHSRRAPDGAAVEIVARSAPYYRLAHPGIARLVIRGEGRVEDIQFWTAVPDLKPPPIERLRAIGRADDLLNDDPHIYAPLSGIDGLGHDFEARLEAALPAAWRRPFEDPHGWGAGNPPPVGTTPELLAAELARIAAVVAAGPRQWVASAWGGSPRRQPVSSSRASTISANADATQLLVRSAAVDPGLSRWLGWTDELGRGQLDGFERDQVQDDWRVLWVAAVPVAAAINSAVADEAQDALSGLYECMLGEAAWGELRDKVQAQLGLMPVVLLAACPGVRYAPPDVPPAPSMTVHLPGSWLPDVALPPAASAGALWRQELTVRGAAPRGPVSVVRLDPDPETTHVLVPALNPGDDDRYAPKAAGYSDLGGRTRCLVVDGAVPGTADEATWAVSLGDWAGRWGPPGFVGAERPPSPPPAPPTLQAHHDAAAGVMRYRLTPPPPGPAGSGQMVALRLTAHGVSDDQGTIPVDVGQQLNGTATDRSAPAPETTGGTWHDVTASAVSVDDQHQESVPTTVTVRVVDARPVAAPSARSGMLVTGRRGGGRSCEVQLTWPALANAAGYRVLEASEAVLLSHHAAATGAQPVAPQVPRAERAAMLIRTGGGSRADYGAALDADISVDTSGGRVTAQVRRPSGQTGVTLLRVLSVAAAPDGAVGVESPFENARPFALVVPLDEVPPAPWLVAGPPVLPDPAHATADALVPVRVVVTGLSARVLAQLDAGPPQARILRDPQAPAASGADPWFWPEVAVVPLAPAGAADVAAGVPSTAWTAVANLPLAVWSSTRLVAMARYPGERLTATGLDSPGEDEHTEVVAVPPGPKVLDSPWGPPGVPLAVLVDGGALPAPVATLPVLSTPVGPTDVRVGGLVVAPGSAPAPVRLELYGRNGNAPMRLLDTVPVTAASMTVRVPGRLDEVVAVCVDPFGRRST